MADALVSAVVGTIIGNLNSSFLTELGVAEGLKTELQNLKRSFTMIQALLQDAEEKQWKSEVIKLWLFNLKDVAYDAEDLLDDFAIEAQYHQQRRDLKNRVKSFLSLNHNSIFFRVKIARKLKNVTQKLAAIVNEKNKLDLTERVWDGVEDHYGWRLTTSIVDESTICGRRKEKEDLIDMLLSSLDDFSVHAICGMGGLGKTTLAQLVYNHESIKRHFDLQVWVCVSIDFNMIRLTRAIIESIDGIPSSLQELDPLLQHLQEKLSAKRFLLVLDDVWDDDRLFDNWSMLKAVLRCGAKGGSVFVTTRSVTVADKMATTLVQHMETLSDDDSWLLFKQLAFRMRRREEYAHLEEIGMEIVKKCGGVPLAIKALGSLMWAKKKEYEWFSVRNSEIWDLPNEGSQILPALRLSYMNLKPHLKKCFAFCCIFPKDYLMEKEELLALWMANGFISCEGELDLHVRGDEVFNEIVGRSLFQEVEDDRLGNITCKMHDLFHDLAQSIMKHECCLIEDGTKLENLETIRHVNLDVRSSPSSYVKKLSALQLRSLLFSYADLQKLLPFSTQKHLKALHINSYLDKELPKFVCNLKHLRHLDVSHSRIEKLPESITSFPKLQTLNLRCCFELLNLPKGLKKLKSLIYLDNKSCISLVSMPAGMGELICLRKLSMFIVGKEEGHHIDELEGLNHISGELSIKNLHNVKSTADASKANLTGKVHLLSLKLSWEEGGSANEKHEKVLSVLQPPKNLKELEISGYRGSKFSNWMMNLNLMLPNLAAVMLNNCDHCEQLPPFGKLQFLKNLSLREMNSVKCILNDDHLGGNQLFPSLDTLHLDEMKTLEQWGKVTGTGSFVCLRDLHVRNCPLLIEFPIFPSVKELHIYGGDNGDRVTLLRSIRNLTSLTSLFIGDIPNLMFLPDGFLQNHTLLEELTLEGLRNLRSLSNQILDNLSALKTLHIGGCHELESLPEEDLHCLNSLEKLEINHCPRLYALSGLSSLPSLQFLEIQDCLELSSLPNEIGYLTSLSHLIIGKCPNLMSFPDGVQILNKLTKLKIYKCPTLMMRCKKESGEDWPKIAHISNIILHQDVIQGSWFTGRFG